MSQSSARSGAVRRATPQQFQEERERQAAEHRRLRTGQWQWLGNCANNCRLNPENLGPSLADTVKRLLEAGESDRTISVRLRDLKYDVSAASIQRHRVNHLFKEDWHSASQQRRMPGRPVAPETPEPTDVDALDDVDNITALRRIIALGMKRLPQSKITADLVVKAIDLEERLTRGSKSDALMEAIKGAFTEDEDEDEGESPMAAAARLAVLPEEFPETPDE